MGSRCSVPKQNLEDMSQSRSIVETALELGYTTADVDEMFRSVPPSVAQSLD